MPPARPLPPPPLRPTGKFAEAAHAAEISLNHVVMKFHRSDFTDDTVGDFTARPSGAHLKKPAAAPAAGNIPHCTLFNVHCLVS